MNIDVSFPNLYYNHEALRNVSKSVVKFEKGLGNVTHETNVQRPCSFLSPGDFFFSLPKMRISKKCLKYLFNKHGASGLCSQ